MVKGAFCLEGGTLTHHSKLMVGSTPVSIPRPIVTEFQESGCLSAAELGSEEEWAYISLTVSEEGRSRASDRFRSNTA